MIAAAERDGTLKQGSTIVEATSGNTGISLAMLSVARGYRCVLVMPEDMSTARQTLLRSYGAEIVLTQAQAGMRGAVDEAERIVRTTQGAFMPHQFDNPENPRAHEETTAVEIWEATEGKVDAFVAGVGTGGTLTGVARGLRKRGLTLKVYAVEPKGSAVLSGGKRGLHGIQGLGAGFMPSVLDRSQIDEVVVVSDLDAERMTTHLAREEGLLIGPSSGANVQAAVLVARRMQRSERVRHRPLRFGRPLSKLERYPASARALGSRSLDSCWHSCPCCISGVPRIQWTPRHRGFWAASNCSGLTPPR